MWCHWCQCYVMLIALLMALLHFLGQDEQNEVQHDFLGHFPLLALVSHDAKGVINGNIAFFGSRQLK